MIYGNTFIFSDTAFGCRRQSMMLNKLWILSMILISWGYLYMASFLLMCCSMGLSVTGLVFGEQKWAERF